MGLAHAWHAARAGLSVVVFDRNPQACGASVRNFGMLAVVAQRPGPQLRDARRALACWQEVAAGAGIAMRQAGCLFLARVPEEMSVLSECAAVAKSVGHTFETVAKDKLNQYLGGSPTDHLLGGLWSPDAWKVDQRQAMVKMADWLRRDHGVTFHYSAQVNAVSKGVIETASGRVGAGHIILSAGDEFATLFPDAFRSTGVTRCRLQMMRTHPQPHGYRLVPFVLGGLSMTRYSVFDGCPSLGALQDYQTKNQARHLAQGIHVIACQEDDGSITIGDSHHYGSAPELTGADEIDQLILDDLAGLIALPKPKIADHWLGHYAHLPGVEVLVLTPGEGVTAVTMTNGQGMTHAFAVAENVIEELLGRAS
ncbi:N-methyltryptophan oxidase [Roseovarius litorisediminis]|uniref:N-methyltryptophan oxidase n=2 Tax=Roseovarius litorisediminis TaxID=1312363 RepID=A0A1Y5TEU9_9RHOB|nr:N-methyltryptophan oxidase [Roseovarius litorisediminis]